MWNKYKYGWCARLRGNQDTTLRLMRTIVEVPPQEKKMKKQKSENDFHVLIPRHLLSNHERRDLYRRRNTKEFTPRDFGLMIEDVKVNGMQKLQVLV